MADNKVELEIDVTTKDAINSLKNFEKQATQSLGGAEKIVSGFKASFVGIGAAIAAGFAGLKIAQFFEEGIAAAAETESAVNALGTQMKLTGDFTETALQSFVDFADEIERTTNVSDDLIIQQAAVAKAFGLTDVQTKSLLNAAVELSTVTGDSLPTSVDQLIKSYNGQSKALEKTVQDVRGLTKDQLAAGAAVDLINQKLGGSASATLNTYAGSIASVGRAFEDFQKEIGKSVVENQTLVALFRATSEAFDRFTESFKGKNVVSGFIDTAVNAFLIFGETVARIGGVIDSIVNGVIITPFLGIGLAIAKAQEAMLNFAGATDEVKAKAKATSNELQALLQASTESALQGKNSFNKFGDEFATVRKRVKELSTEVKKSGVEIKKATDKQKPFFDADDLNKAKSEFKSFSDSLVKQVGTETQKINAERQQQLDKLKEFKDKGVITAKQYASERVVIEQIASEKISKINIEENKRQLEVQRKDAEENKKEIQAAYANPISVLYKFVSEGGIDTSVLTAAGVGLATGFISAIQKGAEGAKEFGAKVAEGIGTTLDKAISDDFLFGLGGLFKELFAFTSQTPEEIKAQIKGFIAAIPDLFENLADSGPAIAEGFIEAIFTQGFGEKLVKSMVRSPALEALGKKWGIKSAEQFTEKVGAFFQPAVDAIKQFFEPLTNALKEFGGNVSAAFQNFIAGIENSSLAQALNGFIENLKNFIGEFAGQISNFFTSFFEGVGTFFSQLGEGAKALIQGIFTGIGNFFAGVAEFVGNLGQNIGDAIKNAFEAVGNFFSDGFNKIKDGFSNIFNDFVDKIKGLFGGGSGGGAKDIGGKISGGFKKVFGLAEGGVVPPGFPNDTYPAFLTSGEKVVPPAKSLPEDSGVNTALLTAILTELKKGQSVETSVNFNGRALADIILQLNRNNARLAG